MIVVLPTGVFVDIAEDGPLRGGFSAPRKEERARAGIYLRGIDAACDAANAARDTSSLEGRVGPWHGAQRGQRAVLRRVLAEHGVTHEAVSAMDSQGGCSAFKRVPFEPLPSVDSRWWAEVAERHPVTP